MKLLINKQKSFITTFLFFGVMFANAFLIISFVDIIDRK